MLKKIYSLPLLLVFLSGCAQLGNKVTVKEGDQTWTYSEAAYAQKVISENQPKPATCDTKLSDLDKGAQRDFMLMAAMGRDLDLCGNQKQVASGRNYFDAKTEIGVSRHQTIRKGLGVVSQVATGAIIAGAAEGIVDSIAKHSGDRYDVQATQNNQQYNNAGDATSNDGLDGVPSSSDSLASTTGTGGSGGPANGDQTAPRNNVFNIGNGDVAIAGERASSGQSNMNGDSASQAILDNSEVKQSPIGDDQQGLQNSNDEEGEGAGGFSDDDGGQTGLDI